MTDAQALQTFVTTRCDEAFAKLVERHLDLVYAAALRQSRDRHLAEEITQAVFVILARKAGSIRDAAHLPGWLIRTTRYAAMNALKGEVRRRRRESEAAAMAPDSYAADESEDTARSELLAALDEQLASLGEADRTALALRFFQGLPLAQVGEAMGSSADAAQKRIARAMQKLRSRFARAGIIASVDSITAVLIAENIHAPTTLGAAITTIASSTNVSCIAKQAVTTMFWTPLRLAMVSVASIGIVTGGTVLVVEHATEKVDAAVPIAAVPIAAIVQPAPVPRAPGVLVAKIPNVMMGTINPVGEGFERGFGDEKRAGQSPITIVSTTPAPHSMGAAMFMQNVTPLRGKRVRVSAYLKTEKVEQYAGITAYTVGDGNRILAFDDMGGRGIRGTHDYELYETILDISPDANVLSFGAVLHMKGKLWADSFLIEVVGDDVPTTDDQHWHKWSWRSCEWASAIDESCQRNGHPTTRLSSNPDAVRGGWAFYEYTIRDVHEYAGKRIRLTMWLKSENVAIKSGPHIFVQGPGNQRIADDGMNRNRPITGTRDWQQYEAISEVPLEATSISPGITLNGTGAMWIDDVHVEVLEP